MSEITHTYTYILELGKILQFIWSDPTRTFNPNSCTFTSNIFHGLFCIDI